MSAIPSPKPFGICGDAFCRNWSTSKGSAYADNYDSIFKKRTNQPGYTKTVYGSGGKREFANADKLTPREMGVTLKVTAAV